MIVRLSARAETDLLDIADHIARDDPRRALSFVREMRDACLGLADTGRMYPLAERYAAQGIRRRLFGRYLIYYRVEADAIVIIHLRHGARDDDEALAD